jgi:hypothetical protein
MIAKRYLIAPLAGVALLAAGCGSNGSSSTSASGGGATNPSAGGMMTAHTGAQVTVQDPKPGTVVHANSVPFDAHLSNFQVDCNLAGSPPRPGVGHYHVEIDGSLVNMFCSPRGSVSMQNLQPGRHMLTFLPAENNHVDDTGAEQEIPFVWKPSNPPPPVKPEQNEGKPSVRILSPKPGTTVHGGFDFTIQPRNFHLSCALYGKEDIPGYGHWHINVDATNQGMMGMGTMMAMSCQRTFHVSLAGVKPGPHTFFAILEDNQHRPTPGAQASVKLNVR